MDLSRGLVPTILCAIVTLMQILAAMRLYSSIRSQKTKLPLSQLIFDIGAVVFLTGMQILLVRSVIRSYWGDSLASTLVIIGIMAVVLAVLLNVINLWRRV